MKKETWILVANGSLAKIFKIEKNKILTEIKQLTHPASRQHEGDLVSSKPGRTFNSVGVLRHAYEPPQTQKVQEFNNFAKISPSISTPPAKRVNTIASTLPPAPLFWGCFARICHRAQVNWSRERSTKT